MDVENDLFVSAADLVKVTLRKIEDTASSEQLSGVPTGFYKLDKITDGWQPSDLIVIAANTSVGKSAFALSMIRNTVIDFGIPVAMFSPEMSSVQIMQRLISLETGFTLSKLRSGNLESHEWQHLSVKTKALEKAQIYIDDTPNISIQKLSDLARQYVLEMGVKLFVIDNIHLMSSGNTEKNNFTREQEISIIMRGLKALSKELYLPIVVISQLSRINESRGYNKRPILSDLRGSGTIEEIADIVSFIYRPEYYKIDEWDDEEQMPTQGQAEFIFAKHRNGSLDNIRLKFIASQGRFENLLDIDYDEQLSRMGHDTNPFASKLPSSNDAFGSNLSSDEDSNVPF